MLIATYNCNSVRKRLPLIREWLHRFQPDVLALQETKSSDQAFPAEDLRQDGWFVACAGETTGRNGVAMITKAEPDAVCCGFPGDEAESRSRLMHLSYRGYDIVNTYVPQGRSLDAPEFQFKLEWLSRLREYFSTHFSPEKTKLLWTGDLNVAPTPDDVHDTKKVWPHVCHCEEIISRFESVKEWGFYDIFRKHIKDTDVYTFWDYRVKNAIERGLGWRVDHFLATQPLAQLSADCFVDTDTRKAETPSDHALAAARFTDA